MRNKENSRIIFEKPKTNDKFENSTVLFIDRDGVIIEDTHYINDPKKVILCKGAKKFIRKIYEKNIPIIIVTNQSGISKNLITWAEYNLVTKAMLDKLEEPNPITAIYANSSISDMPQTNWRKPNPTMIKTSIRDLNLRFNQSILIGDRKSDLIAGLRAGITYLIHVETGYGKVERKKIKEELNKSDLLKKYKTSKIFFINNLNNFPYEIL
tara:strand:+ start:4059 stop:4691 length:633 start_codon:yes stop_codon:yes gene_type:complete